MTLAEAKNYDGGPLAALSWKTLCLLRLQAKVQKTKRKIKRNVFGSFDSIIYGSIIEVPCENSEFLSQTPPHDNAVTVRGDEFRWHSVSSKSTSKDHSVSTEEVYSPLICN